jgi:hypothetical protein
MIPRLDKRRDQVTHYHYPHKQHNSLISLGEEGTGVHAAAKDDWE